MNIRIQVIALTLIFWCNLFMSSCEIIRVDQRNKEIFDAPQNGKISNDIHSFFSRVLTKERALINDIPEEKIDVKEFESYSYSYDASDERIDAATEVTATLALTEGATVVTPTEGVTTVAPTESGTLALTEGAITGAPTEGVTPASPTEGATTAAPTVAPTQALTTAPPTQAATTTSTSTEVLGTAAPTEPATTASTTNYPSTPQHTFAPSMSPTLTPTPAPTGYFSASFTLEVEGVVKSDVVEAETPIKNGLASIFSVLSDQISLTFPSGRRLFSDEVRMLSSVLLAVVISDLFAAYAEDVESTLDLAMSDGTMLSVFNDAAGLNVTQLSIETDVKLINEDSIAPTTTPTIDNEEVITIAGVEYKVLPFKGMTMTESILVLVAIGFTAVVICVFTVKCYCCKKEEEINYSRQNQLPNFYV